MSFQEVRKFTFYSPRSAFVACLLLPDAWLLMNDDLHLALYCWQYKNFAPQ